MEELDKLEETSTSTTSVWAWISALLFLTILGGVAAVYEYAHFDGVDAKKLKANYIKKGYISFSDLEYSEQQEYVLSSTIESKNEIIEKYKKILAEQKTSPTEVVKTCQERIEPIKDTAQKIVMNVKDTSSKKMLEQRLQCEDTEVGSYRISDACKKRVQKFISKVENDTTIEIIPLVDKNDFAILEALADMGNSAYMKSQEGADMLCTMVNSMGLNVNDCAASWLDSLHLSKSELQRLSFIANTGLGKLRSNEAGWYISTLTKNEIQPVNYHITTNNKRGFIVRLYK